MHPRVIRSLAAARLRAAGSPGAFARGLAADGITHVVINHDMLNLYMSGTMPEVITDPEVYPESLLRQEEGLMASFIEQHLEQVERLHSVRIFRLRGEASGE